MPLEITVPKLREETNSVFAYRVLYHNIMTLQLAPGELLNEPLLSEALGLSRTPLREALFRLRQEHLVDIIPQRESMVSLIDFTLVHEALFLRGTIEPRAIAMAGEMATPQFLKLLEENMEKQREILEKGEDFSRFFHLDNTFHQMIYNAAGLEHLWENISLLSTHYNRLRYLDILVGEMSLRPLYLNHREIYQFILNKNSQHMEDFIQHHLSGFQKSQLFLRPEFQGYFKNLSHLPSLDDMLL